MRRMVHKSLFNPGLGIHQEALSVVAQTIVEWLEATELLKDSFGGGRNGSFGG